MNSPLVLQRQEKTAILLLLLIIISCAVGTVVFSSIGKNPFAKEYQTGLFDGTLVHLSGTITSITKTDGGHHIFVIGEVPVFIPTSAGSLPALSKGEWVSVIGVMQHWNGKEEILVEDREDIRKLEGYPEKSQHS